MGRKRGSSQKDDWYALRSWVVLDEARCLPPVHSTQKNIHQDDIRHFRPCQCDAARAVSGPAHAEASTFQAADQHVATCKIVFHKQYFCLQRCWRTKNIGQLSAPKFMPPGSAIFCASSCTQRPKIELKFMMKIVFSLVERRGPSQQISRSNGYQSRVRSQNERSSR
jgi:hypothetical protein